MPVHVFHGKKSGPRLFISAALHGDELNGIEIIRRLMQIKTLKNLKGTLIVIPVVNVYGLIHHSRYLPDRRDLNRSFPGSETGSLTARLANVIMKEIVSVCTHGIDLHTGAVHRSNLPQIRADLDDPETKKLAQAFGVPVLLNSEIIKNSLRYEAANAGVKMLLYEAGEALRFDEISIRAGVSGVLNVMRELGMLKQLRKAGKNKPAREPYIARSSSWVRAPESGMLRTHVSLGTHVEKNQLIGYVYDPYSGNEIPIVSNFFGIVIGRVQIPLVHEGEAIYHIARFRDAVEDVADQVEVFHMEHGPDSEIDDEMPIV